MKRVPVIILGAGGVGSALIRQIVNGRQQIAARNNCQFDIVAVTDSKTWLWQPTGLDDETLLDIVKAKQAGETVDPQFRQSTPAERKRPSKHAILDALSEAELGRAIIVDVTAADGTESVLKHALNLGHCVVLANKKPLANAWETSEGFYNHARVRYESTVGGGQPVIATCRYLADVNDPIYGIEGQMSGTLGYICSQLDKGIAFSTAVQAAKAQGFTEPDPREDLGGMDVMRKTLILARMAGWPLEAGDITVESLYPENLVNLSVPEFMDAIAVMDNEISRKAAEAAAEGYVLRYVAEVDATQGRVGLKKIPASSGLANLKYISFRSERYDDEPLLIGGKGAGVEMTAAGVIGDMIGLTREIF